MFSFSFTNMLLVIYIYRLFFSQSLRFYKAIQLFRPHRKTSSFQIAVREIARNETILSKMHTYGTVCMFADGVQFQTRAI